MLEIFIVIGILAIIVSLSLINKNRIISFVLSMMTIESIIIAIDYQQPWIIMIATAITLMTWWLVSVWKKK